MRRHLLIVFVFLLAGAVVNVAVAWGTIRWVPRNPTGKSLASLPPGSEWPRKAPAHWPPPNKAITTVQTWTAKRQLVFHVPNWPTEEITYEGGMGMIGSPRPLPKPGDKIIVRLPSDLFVAKMMVIEVGWPLLTLVTQHRTEAYHQRPQYAEYSTGWINAFMTPDPQRYIRLHGRSAHPFPYQPLWPGFIVNTIFYAVVVLVLWLAVRAGYVFVFRYLTRSRRGLCPKCAYPMGESAVCSECGKALPNRVGA